MKFIIQMLILVGFAAGAITSGAAPRAAEDPGAVVLSTTASAPRVKREQPHESKKKAGKHGTKKAKAVHGKKIKKAL